MRGVLLFMVCLMAACLAVPAMAATVDVVTHDVPAIVIVQPNPTPIITAVKGAGTNAAKGVGKVAKSVAAPGCCRDGQCKPRSELKIRTGHGRVLVIHRLR